MENTITKIKIIDLKPKKFKTNERYYFVGFHSLYVPSIGTLQVLYKLYDNEDNEVGTLLENYNIHSKEFEKLIAKMYVSAEIEPTLINAEDFLQLVGSCRLDKKKGSFHININSIEWEITPGNSLSVLD